MQTTLKSAVTLRGVGLHSGSPVRLRISPASAEMGIWFKRTDSVDGDALIPARWDMVERTPLCTKLVNEHGVSVSTVEHLMAALAGCGIHNAMVEVSGPEVPILDGSSAPFVAALLRAGVQRLDAPVRGIEVLRAVEVRDGDAWARLEPYKGLSISFDISFPDAAIGEQSRELNMANGAFVHTLCDSRTFCRQADVDRMHAAGLGLGGSLSNAVVVDGARVLNPDGLRHADEMVRHKMLDALGDLYMADAILLGRYVGHKAGHALTNTLLRALFGAADTYRSVEIGPKLALRLPGAGVTADDLPRVA